MTTKDTLGKTVVAAFVLTSAIASPAAAQDTDTQKPTTPRGLSCSEQSPGDVADLTWKTSTDNVGVTGYQIYTYEQGESPQLYSTVPVLDAALASMSTSVAGDYGQTINAYIKAIDGAGNTSSRTNISDCSFEDLGAPTAPTDLTGAVLEDNRIELFWTASTDNFGIISRYDVEITSGDDYRSSRSTWRPGAQTIVTDQLPLGLTYKLKVVAVDPNGNRSLPTEITLESHPDVERPGIVRSMDLALKSGTSIEVSFGGASDNSGISHYQIYRSVDDGAFELLAAEHLGDYLDKDLQPETKYSYYMRAVDTSDNVGWRNGIESLTTMTDDIDISRPSHRTLTVDALSSDSIEISWPSYVDDVGVVRYEVYAAQRNEEMQLIAELDGEATTFVHEDLPASTWYNYRVFAFDAAGNRSYSGRRGARTDPSDNDYPTVSRNMTVTAIGDGEITLDWDPSQDDDGIASYNVYWGEDVLNGYFIVRTSGTSISIGGFTPGTTYEFYVRAVDTNGLQGWRNGIGSATAS